MQHIKQCLSSHKILNRLREKLQESGDKQALLALLTPKCRSQVVSVMRTKQGFLIKLKSAYALYAVKDSVRNFHEKVRVIVSYPKD